MIKDSTTRWTVSKILYGLNRRLQTVWQGLSSIPTKLWYANNVGLINNVVPLRQLKRLQHHFSKQNVIPSFELMHQSAAESLQSNGYFIIPAWYDKNFLHNIKNKMAKFIENPDDFIYNPSKTSRFLINPLDKLPEIIQFLSEDICRIIAAYYHCAFRIHHLQIWRNYHIPNINQDRTDQFSNTFHHDKLPVTGLRGFVLLSDNVTRETGAFRFHDKKTSKKIIRRLQYFHRNMLTKSMRKRLIDASTLQFFEGNIGDVCIVNTQECLHAASVPKQGCFRDMLEFEIYPTSGPLLTGDALLKTLPPNYQSLVFYNERK